MPLPDDDGDDRDDNDDDDDDDDDNDESKIFDASNFKKAIFENVLKNKSAPWNKICGKFLQE